MHNTWFLRFYGAGLEERIGKCLDKLRALGHQFLDTREEMGTSVNPIVPNERAQVKLTFPDQASRDAFLVDAGTKEVYSRYAAPAETPVEVETRLPGMPAYSVSK